MIKLLSIFKEKQENGVQYHVKADGFKGGEYDLVFDSRDKARAYKKALKSSNSQLQAVIIRREYMDNFIADEREVY